MARAIPHSYYKLALVLVWALSILCVAATWVGFAVDNIASKVFAMTVDVLLTLMLIMLIVFIFLHDRPDKRIKEAIFIFAAMAHVALFVLIFIFQKQIENQNSNWVFVFPAIHTLILIAISVVGIYFWIRNKFSFKNVKEKDAVAAFGGPIEEPTIPEPEKPVSLEPEEPKKSRDEKTGIVSL